MRIAVSVGLALFIAACGPELSPEERAQRDAEAVEQVEASQKPPAIAIAPAAIRQPDIEKHDMFGLGCSFAAEGGGMGAIAITLIDKAFMKVDGEVLLFAPDVGSPETRYGTREKFDGKQFSFRLELLQKDGEQVGAETMEHDARLVARDGRDRIIYQSPGYAQCGA